VKKHQKIKYDLNRKLLSSAALRNSELASNGLSQKHLALFFSAAWKLALVTFSLTLKIKLEQFSLKQFDVGAWSRTSAFFSSSPPPGLELSPAQ
jgi:hypothetical protein